MQPLTYVLKTLERQALNGSPLVTRVPRPPTVAYVLLTYVLAMLDP